MNLNELSIPARVAQGTCSQAANEDLRRRVVNALRARRIPGTESLAVEANAGLVVVSGRLPSIEDKRLCVACCRRVAGVVTFIDNVDVRSNTEGVIEQGQQELSAAVS